MAAVAEWLRRLTRNQIPSGSVGSNPTSCEKLFFATSATLKLASMTKLENSFPAKMEKTTLLKDFSTKRQ
jgi:hypothetical protein